MDFRLDKGNFEMKIYEQLFAESKSTLKTIRQLRIRRNEIFQELNESDVYLPELEREFGENMQDETIEIDILIREVDEAYYAQPIKSVRDQGKTQFWKLANEFLDK